MKAIPPCSFLSALGRPLRWLVGAVLVVSAVSWLPGCSGKSARSTRVSIRHIVRTDAAPAAIGPYAQAVLAGDTLYVSGQLPLDPATNGIVPGDIREQTRQVMQNLAAVLAATGCTFDDTVQAQVYLADLNDFTAMNEIYGRHFKSPPARATVQVARLPRDARIEIAMIAVRPAH